MGGGVGDVVHLAVVVLGTGVEVSACNEKVKAWERYPYTQYCGPVTFWYGYGSKDPCL